MTDTEVRQLRDDLHAHELGCQRGRADVRERLATIETKLGGLLWGVSLIGTLLLGGFIKLIFFP